MDHFSDVHKRLKELEFVLIFFSRDLLHLLLWTFNDIFAEVTYFFSLGSLHFVSKTLLVGKSNGVFLYWFSVQNYF